MARRLASATPAFCCSVGRDLWIRENVINMDVDRQLAREAKAIVALAFRNGPIEDIHAGRPMSDLFGQTRILENH